MPAFPIHLLVVFGGTLTEKSAGDEIWQCGIRCATQVPPLMTEAEQDAYLAEIRTPLNAWWTSAAAFNRSDCRLSWVKANLVEETGTYRYPTTSRYDYPTPAAGAATPTVPSFLSVVLSWTTAASRGYNARGRIYPPNNPLVGGGSTVSSVNINTMLPAAKALLTAVANTSSSNERLRVVPSIIGPGTKSGSVVAPRPITGIRIGNVWDAQKRRKNAVAETYSAVSWP